MKRANASQLRRNFEGSQDLYVPAIYWDFVRKNVLAMERVYGTPIRDTQSLIDQGTDMERLAAMGVEIFSLRCLAIIFSMRICIREIFLLIRIIRNGPNILQSISVLWEHLAKPIKDI